MIRAGSGSEATDEDYDDLFDYGAEYNYESYGSGSGSSFWERDMMLINNQWLCLKQLKVNAEKYSF